VILKLIDEKKANYLKIHHTVR